MCAGEVIFTHHHPFSIVIDPEPAEGDRGEAGRDAGPQGGDGPQDQQLRRVRGTAQGLISQLLVQLINFRGESNISEFYHFCSCNFLFLCVIFTSLIYLAKYWHPQSKMGCREIHKERKGVRMRPKKRALHELPCIAIVKFGTIRLVS